MNYLRIQAARVLWFLLHPLRVHSIMVKHLSVPRLALLSLLAIGSVDCAPASNPGLRGSEDLLGYNPTNVLSQENTDDVGDYELLPGQKEDADIGEYLDFSNVENPQPIRGSKGGTDPGPRTPALDKLFSDRLAPPGTDKGDVGNAQWSLALSKVKQGKQNAGWSRQQNENVLPDAEAMAGVDMRLEPGGYRELHWHVASEWALMLNGSARVQVRRVGPIVEFMLTRAGCARRWQDFR